MFYFRHFSPCWEGLLGKFYHPYLPFHGGRNCTPVHCTGEQNHQSMSTAKQEFSWLFILFIVVYFASYSQWRVVTCTYPSHKHSFCTSFLYCASSSCHVGETTAGQVVIIEVYMKYSIIVNLLYRFTVGVVLGFIQRGIPPPKFPSLFQYTIYTTAFWGPKGNLRGPKFQQFSGGACPPDPLRGSILHTHSYW